MRRKLSTAVRGILPRRLIPNIRRDTHWLAPRANESYDMDFGNVELSVIHSLNLF